MRPVAQIAQSVEQRIENPRVRGSIPRLGTMILKPRIYAGLCRFWASQTPLEKNQRHTKLILFSNT